MRTSKTVNGVTTTYYWLDGRLYQETNPNYTLIYKYDESGSVIGFTYKTGTTSADYYYVHNIQGEIMCIIDSAGNIVVEYSYDPWGCIEAITGIFATTIGVYNPIRYKDYYYDTETGFYYCQSRYYDPEICRWINADSYISTGQGILCCNMFAYCGNNPVMFYDPNGRCYIANGCTELVECKYAATYEGDGVVLECGKILAEKKAHASKDDLSEQQMQENVDIIILFLFEKGWHYNAICALLGNIQVESKFNPGRHQDGGRGYGLVQWDPPSKYLNWAQSNGYSANSMLGQLEYLLYSMQPGVGEWFDNPNVPGYNMSYNQFIVSNLSIEYLTLVFLWSYERPSIPHTNRRINFAISWDNYLR